MMGFGDANPHHRWNGFLIHGQFNAFLPRQSVNITLAAKTSCRNTIPNADLALGATAGLSSSVELALRATLLDKPAVASMIQTTIDKERPHGCSTLLDKPAVAPPDL